MIMLIGGGLAGFMALNVVQGEAHQIKLNLVNQMGFTGIAVALMGRNPPARYRDCQLAVRFPDPGWQ